MLLWIGMAILVFACLWLLKAYVGLIIKLFTNPIGLILIIIAAIWWFNTGTPATPSGATIAHVTDTASTLTPRGFSDVATEVFWFIVALPLTIATFILDCIIWILDAILYVIS